MNSTKNDITLDFAIKIFDKESPIIKLSPYRSGMSGPNGDGVTGYIGLIISTPSILIVNNNKIKGGSYYPTTIRRQLFCLEMAYTYKLPCIYIVNSGGAFLPEQAQIFPEHFGRTFHLQSILSAMSIPQISFVTGMCTAGGAYIPAMSDYVIMLKNAGTIYLAGPPLVKAATGEIVSEEELGGAMLHTRISGVSDHAVDSIDDGVLALRDFISATRTINSGYLKVQDEGGVLDTFSNDFSIGRGTMIDRGMVDDDSTMETSSNIRHDLNVMAMDNTRHCDISNVVNTNNTHVDSFKINDKNIFIIKDINSISCKQLKLYFKNGLVIIKDLQLNNTPINKIKIFYKYSKSLLLLDPILPSMDYDESWVPGFVLESGKLNNSISTIIRGGIPEVLSLWFGMSKNAVDTHRSRL